MAAAPSSFLGRGWHFPPTFGDQGRDVWLVADEEDIVQSLQILLSTAQGERVMRDDYGCELSGFVFEEIDGSLAGKLAETVRRAIVEHEPRIAVEELRVDGAGRAEGMVLIRVVYRVLATNSRYNLVFPFYRDEGVRP